MAFDLDDEELKATRIMNGSLKLCADNMFEKLGYKKKNITDEFIVYSKKELRYNSQKEMEVCIDFNCYDKYLMTKNKSYFCLDELQAINKKCKEMGWI